MVKIGMLMVFKRLDESVGDLYLGQGRALNIGILANILVRFIYQHFLCISVIVWSRDLRYP